MYAFVHIHTYVHTCIHTYIHTYIAGVLISAPNATFLKVWTEEYRLFNPNSFDYDSRFDFWQFCISTLYVCMYVHMYEMYVCMYANGGNVLFFFQCGAISPSHAVPGSREYRNVEVISDLLFLSNVCIGRGHHLRDTHTYRFLKVLYDFLRYNVCMYVCTSFH